jgi:hypothetical protein
MHVYMALNSGAPAVIDINGHRFLILSAERDFLEESLSLTGGNEIASLVIDNFDTIPEDNQKIPPQIIPMVDSPETLSSFGAYRHTISEYVIKLSQESNAKVVVAPEGASLKEVVKTLESELPWIH